MFSNFFFNLYNTMWKNIVEPGKPQMIIWRMRIACWLSKATNTRLEYVILITFPLLQWLHERALMLRYSSLPALCNLSSGISSRTSFM
jgi:hypothetical protein